MSSDDEGWTTISSARKVRKTPASLPADEHSHYMTLDQAWKMEEIHRISGLHSVLISEQSRDLQDRGYQFLKVIKKQDPHRSDYEDDPDYKLLEIANKYQDTALFQRT